MLDFDTLNIDLGLERVSAVLKEMGNPHEKFKSIHVAGTNGKGSVCAMLSSIFIEAGFKAGLFTSPHLFKWNERIKIDGRDINDADFKSQKSKVENIEKKLNIELTQFEIVTCMAFQYFAEQEIDIAIVEVGMGGRLDATNVITPLVSVITSVDYDHTEYLGKTLKEIAAEKAGIIKQGIPVVTAETKPEVLDVIKSICDNRDSICEVVSPLLVSRSSLLGSYQKLNEAVSVKIAEQLNICSENINAGLKNTKWPGRFQIVSQNPLIIVDGAHNPAGAKALIGSVKELELGKPITFILGFQGYKDIESMLQIYRSFSNNIILTRSSHPQSADPDGCLPMSRAIDRAKEIGDPIIIAGSLFVAAEALAFLKLDSTLPLL